MEKQVQSQVKEIKLIARILMRDFTNEETKEKLDYVSIELPDPFNDEDFRDIGITPKWKDAGNVFKFYAKKALRTNDVIEFPVTIMPKTYVNKAKKQVTYPGIVGVNPFDGREMEFRVKGKDKDDKNISIFNHLARKVLGLELTSEMPDDDIGLTD